jgi:hypothetical protein
MSPNKKTITQAVLAAIEQHNPKDLEEALLAWWSNLRDEGGLRLTVYGYHAFQAAELESWAVEMDDIKITMNKRLLLELDRKLKYPYFIDYKNKKVIFYSSKEAMMAQIFGSIKSWLDNYESRKPGSQDS